MPDPTPPVTVFKISQPLAQAVLDYLVTKPFNEVYKLVIALQALEKIDPPK